MSAMGESISVTMCVQNALRVWVSSGLIWQLDAHFIQDQLHFLSFQSMTEEKTLLT